MTAKSLSEDRCHPTGFAPDQRRRAEAVVEISCLVLDYDTGTQPPTHALEAWKGWRAALHTTWSHTQEAPRFRVILPLLRPIPASRWPEAWAWAAHQVSGIDRTCKDPSRLYFRPALPSPDAPHEGRIQGGELLDLLGMLPDKMPPAPVMMTRPVLTVPARLAHRAIQVRLAHDAASRERVAMQVGAKLLGEGGRQRATGILCPSCGRPSVWFYLSPDRMTRAHCNHRNSCSWAGQLEDLLHGAA